MILFADNVDQPRAGIRAAIKQPRRAARRGGRPKVLVMIDQEGGLVKRLPGPPSAPASRMRAPEAEGRATGRMLRSLGIDVDLAPVADVAHRGTFLGSRAFGTTPAAVARRACAFAKGLLAAGVAAALKHFPGLGYARVNTDDAPATVDVPRRRAAPRLRARTGPAATRPGHARDARERRLPPADRPRARRAHAGDLPARAAAPRRLAGRPSRTRWRRRRSPASARPPGAP